MVSATVEVGLPPAQNQKELIRQEHQRAELLRLRMGMDGCGCNACQKFYKTIFLDKFGGRVMRYGDIISVISGKVGADLAEDTDDYWTANDSIFVTGGRRFGVTPAGGTVGNLVCSADNVQEVVQKIPDKGIIPATIIQESGNGIIAQRKTRGRPRKRDGEPISRRTYYYREKEGKQGVLI